MEYRLNRLYEPDFMEGPKLMRTEFIKEWRDVISMYIVVKLQNESSIFPSPSKIYCRLPVWMWSNNARWKLVVTINSATLWVKEKIEGWRMLLLLLALNWKLPLPYSYSKHSFFILLLGMNGHSLKHNLIKWMLISIVYLYSLVKTTPWVCSE